MARLTGWFSEVDLEECARQSGFQRRKPRKVTPLLFLQAALVLVSQSTVSLSRWATLLGILGDTRLAKQSLWERLNAGAVEFLQHLLGRVIGARIQAPGRAVPPALQAFTRVLIQDSTTLKLTKKLAALFPGSHNQCGCQNGQLKIQTVFDLLGQRFVSFGLSGFTRNDQAAAQDVVPRLAPGDLVLRDLGYFVLASFQAISAARAFFLSRLRADLTLGDPRTGRPLDLLAQLQRSGHLDQPVWVGPQRMPARLVAIPLPEAVAAERRRKAKANRDRRCKPNARSLQLLGWALFLTNVPRKVCAARTVAEIYGLRWRIETIFKAWKSHFRLTEVPTGSRCQLLAVVYARLLFITLLAQVASGRWLTWRTGHPAPPGSLLKIAALMGDYFAILCFETWNIRVGEALLVQLDYHCRYDRRTRENFVAKLMKLS